MDRVFERDSGITCVQVGMGMMWCSGHLEPWGTRWLEQRVGLRFKDGSHMT